MVKPLYLRLQTLSLQSPHAIGLCTRSFQLPYDKHDVGTGLAVSRDGSMLAVSNYHDSVVLTFDVASGSVLNRIGGYGSRPGQFKQPKRLCFTPDGNVLVVDCGNRRLQEFTVAGVLVRVLCEKMFTFAQGIDVNEDIIVTTDAMVGKNTVSVFDFRSGSFVRGYGSSSFVSDPTLTASPVCNAVRISPAGDKLAVSDVGNGRVFLFSVGLEFLQWFPSPFAIDICFGVRDEIIVACRDSDEILVFSSDGAIVLQTVAPTEFCSLTKPHTVATSNRKTFVGSSYARTVWLFE